MAITQAMADSFKVQILSGQQNLVSGELSLEVFIMDGVNSDHSSLLKIAALAETINPDRIDLNTAVRPPADSGIKAVSPDELAALAKLFGPAAEVVASFKTPASPGLDRSEDTLLGLIQRHPATVAQLAQDYNAPVEQLFRILEKMVAEGRLRTEERDGTRLR